MVPIPAWVHEIDAPRPRHFASALLQHGECAAVVTGAHGEKVLSVGAGYSDTGEMVQQAKLRRDSATPTHEELFFGEEASSPKEGMGMVYESRSDAYRNIQTQKPSMGSAVLDAQIQIRKEERKANAVKPRMDAYNAIEPYQRNTNTALTHPSYHSTTTTLRRLSFRLPASPPLSEDMFDCITGEVDVENALGWVTANMLSEVDISEAGVSGYLERDHGVVEEKEKEEEDDFRWIRHAIREF
jgi:hypothetical protein